MQGGNQAKLELGNQANVSQYKKSGILFDASGAYGMPLFLFWCRF